MSTLVQTLSMTGPMAVAMSAGRNMDICGHRLQGDEL